MKMRSTTLRTFVGSCALALVLAPAAFAQDNTSTSNGSRATVASGQKAKLRGAVVSRTDTPSSCRTT
jgi:hypothetical protein